MFFPTRNYFLAVASLLLAFGIRAGLPASARELPLALHSLPALTDEQISPSESSLLDLSAALPGRGLHPDRLRRARLSVVSLTEDTSDPLLARDLAARAPPA